MAEYRFLVARSTYTFFAKAYVDAVPAEEWLFEVCPNLALSGPSALPPGHRRFPFEVEYETSLRAGFEVAAAAHERRGGAPFRVTFTHLDHTFVDTTAPAVECATAGAVWKAFGNDEGAYAPAFVANRWRPAFEGTVDHFRRIPAGRPHELLALVRELSPLAIDASPAISLARHHMNTLASALEKRGASPAQCNAGDASPEVLRATTALYDAVHDYAKAVVDAAFDSPEGRATVAILLAPIAKRKIAHRREK